MKKLLLSASALMLALGATAQLNAAGDGYTMDNTAATSQCNLNGAPNNGGIMAAGPTLTASASVNSLLATTGPMTLVSEASIAPGSHATWFGLPAISGSGASAQCSNLYDQTVGIDMSSASKITVTGEADAAGAVLEIFIGSDGQWFPATSTYNVGDAAGSSILAPVTFAAANVEETVTIDLSTIDATVWAAWAGKSKIQSVGFRSATGGATFKVKSVKFGTEAGGSSAAEVKSESVSVYPNPATDIVNVNVGTAANATVELTDVTGKVVASVSGVSGSTAINTAAVPAGLYVVSVTSANGVTTSKVVVK